MVAACGIPYGTQSVLDSSLVNPALHTHRRSEVFVIASASGKLHAAGRQIERWPRYEAVDALVSGLHFPVRGLDPKLKPGAQPRRQMAEWELRPQPYRTASGDLGTSASHNEGRQSTDWF